MAHHGSVNPKKLLKEQFVSNLMGSSMLEIAALSTIVPILVVLRQWSSSCLVAGGSRGKKDDNMPMTNCSESWETYMISLVIDYVFIVLPILLIFTVFSDWVYPSATLLFFLLTLLAKSRTPLFTIHGSSHSFPLKRSLLSYRVSVMFITCLCILAVDFKIFPRRFAKTETHGTGLMDLGVGSFVLANALVSRQARYSSSGTWKATLQTASPLIFLGFGRLVFTRGVNYQVHVGEYGVHWNFFFTLSAVSILTSFIKVQPRYCGAFGLLILAVYQICLLSGLNKYLLSNGRALDIISLNKEGIFSTFGYWGLYLVGVHLGHSLFFKDVTTGMLKTFHQAQMKVWFLAIIFWVLTIFLDKYVESVSRRMCNAAYVSLVLAQNFQVLSIFQLSHLIPGQKPLVIEEAFNQNLLGVFILANILTGLINLCFDTLSASYLAALGILLGYTLILAAFAGFTRFFGIRLKFW